MVRLFISRISNSLDLNPVLVLDVHMTPNIGAITDESRIIHVVLEGARHQGKVVGRL